MPDSEAKKAWTRANSTTVTIRLMNRTESDLVQRLEAQTNRAGYIKRLIRQDIEQDQRKNKA